ncbi:alpha/beta fold hydrolase [Sphingomonas sp. KRR8]|uniref:alpha/beta fold hydrolase n=1 Tax=Sphingomonas sp. KRR8 TaxID=2942996 RepID=UPI002021B95E|nr:alpha/beta fold hydrolase [Sphingomonas sp. KRR8]URD61259.1 alpha/beta fold hydrolase [Sphingomonas sp. KRR8]
MPLFLELVRRAGGHDPALAADALSGLRAYQRAPRAPTTIQRLAVAQVGAASLRDCGGSGAPIVLVPSLINPPHILDLDPDCSLADALAGSGRILLVDWGAARDRPLSLTEHISELLLPLLRQIGQPAVLIGYCLGGTLALAAASTIATRGVATLAAPWRFTGYPDDAREAVARLRNDAWPGAQALGLMPMEVLQAAFWSLDPQRTVAKFASFGTLDPASPEARRFVALEDWANGGEALPLAAAAELVDDLFGADRSGSGTWFGLPGVPTLHFTAANDRIVPAATAAPGATVAVPSGHVGMIVGRRARDQLHRPLNDWLARL